jgi:hypothetical protein
MSGVRGAPSWLAVTGGYIVNSEKPDGGEGLIGFVDPSLLQSPPLEVQAIPSAEGAPRGQDLVFASDDTIFSAFYDQSVTTGVEPPPVQLEPRVVPFGRSEIQSLAMYRRHAPEVPYLEGYVLTVGGLFRIEAQTASRWRVSELPLDGVDPLQVWVDGEHGRIGYADGTILSLPLRVKLAAPLRDATVRRYIQLCERVLAVTDDGGLYWLKSSAESPIGEWQQLAIPELPLPRNESLQASSLFEIDDTLYLFTARGAGLRFDVGCNL